MASTTNSKSSTSGSGATGVTGSGSGSGTGAIPTGNIPASSGSQQTNKPPGSSSDENINSQNPNSDSSQKKKKRSKDRRDPQVDMEEAQRAAEEKAEQLRIQAEKAIKQQEEEEINRRYRDEIFQPWGGVSFNTQFTPQGDPPLDLTYDELHSPHFLATSKASCSTITDASVVNRITPSVSAQLDDLDAFLSTSRRYVGDDDNAPIVGELAWATSPANLKGHHLYQDIDPRTPYGALTVEMCNNGRINYRVNYRSATYFATTLMPSSSLPQPSLDSEYVPTKYIFRTYVEDVLKKF